MENEGGRPGAAEGDEHPRPRDEDFKSLCGDVGQGGIECFLARFCGVLLQHYTPRSTLNSLNSRAGNGVCNCQTMLMGRSPAADSSVSGPQAR